MKTNLVILIMIMIMGLLFAADPVVENVRLEQRTDGSLTADIYYDVTDADGDTLIISLKASDDNGATWELPCDHVTGDVGDSVLSGTNKHIVWDFLADNPGVSGDGFQIRVTASDYNGPEMVFVKGGTFNMGSTNGQDDEKPVHTVTLDDFYMDKYEVTNFDYADFLNYALSDGLIVLDNTRVKKDTLTLFNLGAEDCQIAFQNGQFVVEDGKGNNPVIYVTWNGAKTFAEYLNKRLPTEAEWEYAARGGNQSQGYTYSGGNEMDVVGWFAQNSGNSSQPVGQKQANELGIYDMSGNVWEWCADRYDRDYYSTGPCENPYGPSDVNKTGRILRGGAWDEAMSKARPANRNRDKAWLGYKNRGFRCAKGDTNFTRLDAIKITPQDITVNNSESLQLTCTAQYSDGSAIDISKYVSWNIIYGNCGIIDTDGLFTADDLATGSVKIKVLFDGLTAETTITVDSKYETGTMTDLEGKTYKIIKIGNQWWMAENLKTTHNVYGFSWLYTDNDDPWVGLSEAACCYYDDDENNLDIYGAMYNWNMIETAFEYDIFPEGWHAPTDDEWKQLESYLGMSDLDNVGPRGTVEGGMLKESGTDHWNSPNTGATNESGFRALPGGFCNYLTGEFQTKNTNTCFWTSSQNGKDEAWARSLGYDHSSISRDSYNKGNGFYIRLVSDSDEMDPDITMTYPNGGESFLAGNTTSIHWDPNEYDKMVYLDLYQKGVFSIRIAETENDGEFSWNIPSTLSPSNQFTINVIGTQSSMSDESDECFEIEYDDAIFETGTVTDIDGNVYKTIRIGEQWWMMEDLRVTHYRNGDPIPNVTDDTEWGELVTGALCYYNNNNKYADDYGAFYNGYAATDARNIAPEGWHVPTDDEWKELEMYLGMSQEEADSEGDFLGKFRGTDEGDKLKEIGNAHWKKPNPGFTNSATNESGFSARAGGWRNSGMGMYAFYWSSTAISENSYWIRILHFMENRVSRNYGPRIGGFSIRLVRGEETSSELESINITQPYSIVYNGETLQLNCTTNLTDGGSVDISNETTWSITSGSAGTIDNNGLFTSSNSNTGVVTITASYKNQTAETIISVQNNSLEIGTMTDNDGNVYRTVKIGNQWWMAENLRVTHYRNGDLIPNATDAAEWDVLSGAFCYYDNDKKNAAIYGALYNWYAVDDERNIAPEGWHVPSDEEWKEMEMFLGMSMNDVEIDDSQYRGTDEGGKLKEMGTVESRNGLWQNPNTGATNESGFSARPGGYRYPNTGIDFSSLGSYAAFWTATQSGNSTAKMRYLIYDSDMITRYGLYLKHGRSIRLVKDSTE